MPKSNNPFEIDFDTYILQSEPSKQEKGKLWQTAIGLQQIDGLTPSKYLYEIAKRNIDGEITIEEAKQLIDSYYESKEGRPSDDDDTEEADKVSVRIREILAENTFSFTPDLLLSIHKRLFTGVFYKVKAGAFRDCNISKREWVLDSESVLYANADMIRSIMTSLRNSLVRANYTNMTKGIYMNTEYLEKFFRNLLLGESNELKNRYVHIRYNEEVAIKSSESSDKVAI